MVSITKAVVLVMLTERDAVCSGHYRTHSDTACGQLVMFKQLVRRITTVI